MPEQRILDLEYRLAAAQTSIIQLTKDKADLTASLANAEVSLKKSRRTARQDGNTLRDQITTLQSRRF